MHAMLELATAARAIGPRPSSTKRQALLDAVARVARLSRVNGLASVPSLTPAEAVEMFRQVLRLAREAGVPPLQLIAIFNHDEEPAEAGRRDFQ